MTTNDPMTQERLDAIQALADVATTLRRAMPGDWQRLALHLSENVDTLTAEVKRLQAQAKDLARAWDEGAETAWRTTCEGWNGETAGEYTTRDGVAPFREACAEIPNPYEQEQS